MLKNSLVRPSRLAVTTMLLWVLLILTGCIRPESPAGPPATGTPGAAEETPDTGGSAATLEKSKWRLSFLGAPDAETPVVENSTITLEFSADGKAGGAAGCNTYGGSYEVQGDQLLLGEMVSTLMACVDQAVMDQELAYLRALQSAGRFVVDGDTLRIWYDDEQNVLNFTAE
jgi:heat shock protein HslJ